MRILLSLTAMFLAGLTFTSAHAQLLFDANAPKEDDHPELSDYRQCLDDARYNYEARADLRHTERTEFETKLRAFCRARRYDTVKNGMNLYLVENYFRPRYEGIQACLEERGESLPEKMNPKNKQIIADGKKLCQILLSKHH